MTIVIACAVALTVGVVLGAFGEWRLLRPWIALALRQSAVLHTDDRTPVHPYRDAGPDDVEARSRVGRRP